MNRRTFVVLLGAAAGCNAAPGPEQNEATTRTETRTPTRTPDTETATPEPTATPTATATEEPPPTETETPTPTQAEQQGAAMLDRAEQALTTVLDGFTASYGSELTAVTAASTEFPEDPYELQLAFADAQQAYNEAQGAAANNEQELRANRMQACWQFFQRTRDTQTKVVSAYERLARAHDALDQVQPTVARTAVTELTTERQRAVTSFEALRTESSVEAASVIERISPEEYTNKLTQFEADIEQYAELEAPLDRFVEGIKWLNLAQLEFNKDDRNVQNAEEKADTANEILVEVNRTLDAIVDSASEDTTLLPMLESLESMSYEKAVIASELDN